MASQASLLLQKQLKGIRNFDLFPSMFLLSARILYLFLDRAIGFLLNCYVFVSSLFVLINLIAWGYRSLQEPSRWILGRSG